MMRALSPLAAAAIVLLLAAPAVAMAKASVELELVTEQGFPITGGHKWMAVLKDLGLSDLRIRAARSGDRVSVVASGTKEAPVYRVTGILTASNTLRLPHGHFKIHQQRRIADWLGKLKQGGQEGLTAKPAAFGLTAEQLVKLHEQLAVPVDFSTQGRPPKEVIRRLARAMEVPLTVEKDVRSMFDERGLTVAQELKGISAGTALAALLRPLDLALMPIPSRDGRVRISIRDVRQAPESWPAGWPPEKKLPELVPKMFEFLKVDIDQVPMTEALDALGKRLEVPFLLDRSALARHGIDPAVVLVSFPEARTFYKRALDRLLFQARLRGDVRVDEAGQPLVWITTLKP